MQPLPPSDPSLTVAPNARATATAAASTTRLLGRIDRLNRGFGFITDDAGHDHFFHRTDLRPGAWFTDCHEGDRASFVTEMTPRGPHAHDVVLVDHQYRSL